MWWLAMICVGNVARGASAKESPARRLAGAGLRVLRNTLTWRVVGIMRFSPSTEMLTAMLMPAKCRLLLPRMENRALLGA